MTDKQNESFEWTEVMSIFSIRDEEDINDEKRAKILEKINNVCGKFGREYVIRKIALCAQ